MRESPKAVRFPEKKIGFSGFWSPGEGSDRRVRDKNSIFFIDLKLPEVGGASRGGKAAITKADVVITGLRTSEADRSWPRGQSRLEEDAESGAAPGAVRIRATKRRQLGQDRRKRDHREGDRESE